LSYFVAFPRASSTGYLCAFFSIGEPLGDLDKLPGLAGKRHAQVFRAVELIPVALGGKGAQPQLDCFDVHFSSVRC
jgi:hypothetical protein